MGTLRVDRATNSCSASLPVAQAFAQAKNQVLPQRCAGDWRMAGREHNCNRRCWLRNGGMVAEAAWRFPCARKYRTAERRAAHPLRKTARRLAKDGQPSATRVEPDRAPPLMFVS